MNSICWQINLQKHFGGGEVYTAFVSRALRRRGWQVHTLVAEDARFWRGLNLGGGELHAIRNHAQIMDLLANRPGVIVNHGAPSAELNAGLAGESRYTAIAHMPIHNRNPEPFQPCARVFGVSAYVIRTLRQRGLTNVYGDPLYGVADLDRGETDARHIIARSRYDWDERKLRDRSFKYIEPLCNRFTPTRIFTPRPGLTLGIVSRLTTIKQFPELLKWLAPVIHAYPGVNLEIFGAGGWRSVKDLEHILKPIAERVRWWGFQQDIKRIYGLVDFVLGGLPEMEALGLNLLEAQAMGTPVLAVNAPPFEETVEDGHGGFRYTDPREDAGADFHRLLGQLVSGLRPDPAREKHLRRFDLHRFGARLEKAIHCVV